MSVVTEILPPGPAVRRAPSPGAAPRLRVGRSCSGLGTSTGGPCAQGKGETPSLPLKTLLRHLSLADISSPSQLEPQNPLLGGPPHAATRLLFCCGAGLWPPDGDLHPQRLLSIAGLPLPKCLLLSPGSACRHPASASCHQAPHRGHLPKRAGSGLGLWQTPHVWDQQQPHGVHKDLQQPPLHP